ncbi:hypothetical protein [Agromyces cerinus]|uniref:Uncharacterized protein n=1 Tax=Agromyces cerinus subsp. cerinus TaxID=232089 RepID=A0A1N6GJ41_9MICO|nr:hypothetical protein [Agromyces cerinus]SIO07530.1 hypothetical protein SAMN05443544_2622 [Agromyces cerinus subsp. cerinus]
MSDGAASGIDPRFDPRYQRGYAGGEGSTTDASSAAPAAMPRNSEPPAPAPAPDPAPFAGSEAGRPSPGRDDTAPEAAAVVSDPPAERVDDARADAARIEVDDEEHDRAAFVAEVVSSGRSTVGWLIAGWAVTLAAFAFGAYLSWMVNSDIGYYTGQISSSDQWIRELGWTLSPSLMMAGATGVVVVTALAVVVQRRGAAAATSEAAGEMGGDEDARSGRGTAWWALVSIGAISAVGVVWAVGRASEASRANAGLVFDGNGNPTGEQADAFALIALGQFAQSLIGPLALAAVAAFVALVAVETSRATLSAARAR